MKIKQIIEAKKATLGGGFSTGMKQRIDPATLQAMADYRSYKTDAARITPQKEKPEPKYRGGTDIVYKFNTVKFPTSPIMLPNDVIENTNNINDVYDIFIKLGTQRLPKELKAEMRADTEWQRIVKDMWEQAKFGLVGNKKKQEIFVHNTTHDPNVKRHDSPIKLGGGLDTPELIELEIKFKDVNNKYLKKYGIDKTGRQIYHR